MARSSDKRPPARLAPRASKEAYDAYRPVLDQLLERNDKEFEIFNPRTMMEKAIEVMRRSVDEPRADKKASPLVGAVLVKRDGTVDTAFRGECRYGDHAEYTLLERKHPGERLDGSMLFATLEPCAPGARQHPKLGCAQRIVNARIAEVWPSWGSRNGPAGSGWPPGSRRLPSSTPPACACLFALPKVT